MRSKYEAPRGRNGPLQTPGFSSGLPLQASGKLCSNNLSVLTEGSGRGKESHGLPRGAPGAINSISSMLHVKNLMPGDEGHFHGDGLDGDRAEPSTLVS